jgi:hypothetical protein
VIHNYNQSEVSFTSTSQTEAWNLKVQFYVHNQEAIQQEEQERRSSHVQKI